ncbi:MAG TPA: diguanylate cyclase, partial [Gammaproteobacteria bacterium]|nr:diguanylate cyclase [Gammaproteobacteria bacterium]
MGRCCWAAWCSSPYTSRAGGVWSWLRSVPCCWSGAISPPEDAVPLWTDTYGHESGDRVLRVLADTCRSSLRQQDVLGRYGGEEFIAFLPETPV